MITRDPTTTQGYLSVLHALVQRHGAPLALYSDRHAIFTKADPEDAKPTQFERALLQLRIEQICARSPQAKGRVERLFQTLQCVDRAHALHPPCPQAREPDSHQMTPAASTATATPARLTNQALRRATLIGEPM